MEEIIKQNKQTKPVKLAGELSQPLDSLRMGCGDSLFYLSVLTQ